MELIKGKMKYQFLLGFGILFLLSLPSCSPTKVLIVDGQNNHNIWPKSTLMMRQYLEETGEFEVDIVRSKYTWRAEKNKEYLSMAGVPEMENMEEPKTDPSFQPNFEEYDVVISNFGWKAAEWPTITKQQFEKFVSGGGGFVSVHAADNSFPNWPAYNKMIGLGGWGDRTEADGPYVYYSNQGDLVIDTNTGKAGKHGKKHEFPIKIREDNHPITKDMPAHWLTTSDECYAMLRGPAEDMTILATGKDQSENAPTDRHEPVLMVINYGKGRVFHSTLGHDDKSMSGVGFIVSFVRGVEWAATGNVTHQIPEDFPTLDNATSRKFELKK